jgi:hypothetical protein
MAAIFCIKITGTKKVTEIFQTSLFVDAPKSNFLFVFLLNRPVEKFQYFANFFSTQNEKALVSNDGKGKRSNNKYIFKINYRQVTPSPSHNLHRR